MGNSNIVLDVARMLVLDDDTALSTTDITEHARTALPLDAHSHSSRRTSSWCVHGP